MTSIIVYLVKANQDSRQRCIENSYISLFTSHLKQDKDQKILIVRGTGKFEVQISNAQTLTEKGFQDSGASR